MLSITTRGMIALAVAVLASSVSRGAGLGETTHGEDASDIPCVGIRTAKACKDTKASLLSHCVWCESKAVPSQCVTPDVAEKLPKLVFKCDDDVDVDVDTEQENDNQTADE